MNKLYVTTGGAKHVLPQDGITVVEFNKEQIAAAKVLNAMPEDDRNAILKLAGTETATETPKPAGKKRGRKSAAEKAAESAQTTQPAAEDNKPPLLGEVA
jgi:hypothetical protein